MPLPSRTFGPHFTGISWHFRYWAPEHASLEIEFLDEPRRSLALQRDEAGCFTGELTPAPDRLRYRLRIDGAEGVPDPFSWAQPEGVHGPSELRRDTFVWSDGG